MKICPDCGKADLVSEYRDHLYVESGLSNVLLLGLEFRLCPNCGYEEQVMPRLELLHRAIADAIAEKRPRLTGEEIRFLRKHLGWSGDDFAQVMGVRRETVSRWETEKEPMGVVSERLLRLMALRERPISEYPNERFAELANGVAEALDLRLEPNSTGWRRVAA